MPNDKRCNSDAKDERAFDNANEDVRPGLTWVAEDIPLPSQQRMKKLFRKLTAYERVWNEVCAAHERDDRETARSKLKALPDAVDFMMFLLDYQAEPTNTSKAGGEARNANIAPLRNHARRIYQEAKQKRMGEGQRYTHAHFAKDHRRTLESRFEAQQAVIHDAQARIEKITDKLHAEPDAAQLKELREEKRRLEQIVRHKPILPSLKNIAAWLNGL